MQNQQSIPNSILFTHILEQEEITTFIQIQQNLLKKFLKQCSKYFNRMLEDRPKRACIFLANYRLIMESHSKIIKSPMSVNISLHFTLLFTQHLLTQGNYSYAKEILKETKGYLELGDTDLLLLSLCMNNLAIVQYRSAHYNKSLSTALQGISVIQEHLANMHESKNKMRMSEDGVIFVNLLSIAKRNITNILSSYNKDAEFYLNLLRIINKSGYQFTVKYLGVDSIFTSKFQYNQSTIDLPVYDESSIQEVAEPQEGFEIRIAKQLDNIYNILKQLNLQPEVYYIKEHLIPQKEESIDSEIKMKEQSIAIEPQRSISHTQRIIIDEWNTELSILKSSNIGIDVSKDYEFLGHILFRFKRNKSIVEQLITEENLWKIINIINCYDVLPYQVELRKLNNEQFIKKLLIHYLSVSQGGTLNIHPRAKSLINPFQSIFCGQKSFIFLNHIRFRRFRLAICPINSCETIYLQLDFKHKEIYKLVKLKEIQHNFIGKLSKKYYQLQPNYGLEQYEFSDYKEIIVINEGELKTQVVKILKEFENFLIEQQQHNLSELSTILNGSQDYNYYQYTQFKIDIGQFHIIKYRANANSMEINIKNTFQTYSTQGKDFMKGNFTYSATHFQRDFGVNLKASRKNIASISQIILQKFNLKIYEQKLRQEQHQIFQQNAIIQIPITSKCFQRKFIQFENYYIPMTIQIITINNQRPLAIRVTAYEPIKGNISALFIYIVPEYWQKPNVKPNNTDEQSINIGVKRTTQDYDFKKNYFLTNWMQEQGFKLIFNKLEIVNRTLEMRGTNSKFILLDDMLKDV